MPEVTQRASRMENGGAAPFIEAIEEVELRAKQQSDYAKKLRRRLSAAKKALATKPAVASVVSKLVADLQKSTASPDAISLTHLIQALKSRLAEFQTQRRESFPSELHDACVTARLEFATQSDGFAVGPFYLNPDWPKETASIQYAKVDVIKNIALHPKAIVECAISLKKTYLDVTVDFNKFSNRLYEAMQVAFARTTKTGRKDQLRVELPLVHQEMTVIQQSERSRTTQAEYDVPRFVIELTKFIQSDQNMEAEKQFRLETAVIENTKNPKKSLFIPRDLSRGYGEGSYYQAIVFA